MNPRAARILALLGILAAMGAAAQPAAPETPPEPTRPKALETYGGANPSFYRVGYTEFSPGDSALTYSDLIAFQAGFGRYPTAPSPFDFVAIPHLPSGALVTDVEFDWCDSSETSDADFKVFSTLYTGQNVVEVGGTSSSGSSGCAYSVTTVTPPFTVDNNHTQLLLTAFLPETDGSLAIVGAIVYYTLQVSPAPATPTFNDVPATHPFFQFIEALAASGITGGCQSTPPKYCPDAPVTRGQMAVFLAKALGLQFE